MTTYWKIEYKTGETKNITAIQCEEDDIKHLFHLEGGETLELAKSELKRCICTGFAPIEIK